MNEETTSKAGDVSFFGPPEPSFLEKYYQEGVFIFLLIALFVLIIFAIKSRKKQNPIHYFYYFVDRIAILSFLLGCFFAALEIWHGFEKLITVTGSAVHYLAYLTLAFASQKFFYATGVSLVAIIISVIFKIIDKKDSQQPQSS